MSRIGKASRRIMLGAALLAGAVVVAGPAFAQGTQTQAPAYSREEYDAYMAAHSEKVPEQKIKLLDDFVAKYPKSALMLYIDNDYYLAYLQVKDYPKTISAVDKLLTYGEKIDPVSQLQARLARAQAFLAIANTITAPDQLNAARDSARQGLKDADALKKDDKTPQEDFDKQKRQIVGMFDSVVATTSWALKDAPGSVEAYKALLALDPNDATSYYRIGVIDLTQMNPPQFMDGVWALARSISLKGPSEAQIRDYLKKVVSNYQGGAVCDSLLTDEVNQLVTLATGSPDRPASYTLSSADDLQKMRDDTANFIAYLREGGDHGKVMWLATCGLDYPEVVAKIIAIDTPTDGSPIVLHVFTGTTPEETQNGTAADMEVKLDGSQPEAKRLLVGDELRFGATLTGYDPPPAFMLHWEKGKVNPEDIPSETGKKPATKKKTGGEK